MASKSEIRDRINNAASYYRDRLAGKTFLLLFEGNDIEIQFQGINYLHLSPIVKRAPSYESAHSNQNRARPDSLAIVE